MNGCVTIQSEQGANRKHGAVRKAPVSFGDVEAVRQRVVSERWHRVPMSIIRKKASGSMARIPTILTGYGGYGISLHTEFLMSRAACGWIRRVDRHRALRGGGEFGEPWHQAGSVTNKQNVFDDFAACAEFLFESNYTKPSKLAIEGASNGGLLMGPTLAQHPDLMQAVVSARRHLRHAARELDPNGAFNVTEFRNREEPGPVQRAHTPIPLPSCDGPSELPGGI